MSVSNINNQYDQQARREFLKAGALAGLGAVIGGLQTTGCSTGGTRLGVGPSPTQPMTAPPMERVRIGFVGIGGMGANHIRHLSKIDGAEVRAVCDLVPERTAQAQQILVEAGKPKPVAYTRGEWDFLRLCEQEDLDLVYNATPWEWHVPICVAAMKADKHAATEVPAAYTLDGCWELVETAEKYNKHCVMMENCCYDRYEAMCLSMIRQGVFGEILHGECGYLHDLRAVKHNLGSEGDWRLAHSMKRNGNLYPTHGIGPVAQCMNINRGDRLDYLVSMSSPSRGLQAYQQEHLEPSDPRNGARFALGDVNATLIKTVHGKTIYIVHDTNLPRPYSRIHTVQGTRGLFSRFPNRIHVEGRSPKHQWEEVEAYRNEFEHPLWRSEKIQKVTGGHGGMDFLENYRLVHCLQHGLPTDMDVYDAATWSVICDLTERSVAHRSRPMDVPDFTRGRWKTNQPVPVFQA